MSFPLFSLLVAAAPVFEPLHAFVADGPTFRAQGPTGHYEVEASGALRVLAPSPIRFELRSIARDGARCATTLERRQVVGSQVTAHRACQVDERWTSESTGLEHEVVIHERPAGTGALRVELHVDGPWHHQDPTGHFFGGPEGGPGVQYGAAWVIRADQRKHSIAVERVPGGLELVIPESALEGTGAFPLIIDPVIVGPQVSITLPVDVDGSGTFPTIAWSSDGRGYVVWVDRRRGTESDLFAQRLDVAGGPASMDDTPLVISDGDQNHPSMVWFEPSASFVLVYEQSMNDGGIEIHQVDLGRDPGATVIGPATSRGPGTSPSLAIEDGGLVMAYASDPYTMRLTRLFALGVGPIGEGHVDAGITQTAISVGPPGILVGVETYNEAAREQVAVSFLASGGTMTRDCIASPATLPAPDRGTSVLAGPQDNARYLVTRASMGGYRGYKTLAAVESPIFAGNIAVASAAVITPWGNAAGLITIRPASDQLLLTSLMGGRPDVTTPLDTNVSTTPHRHLVAAQPPLLDPHAVWETGLTPQQVVGAPLGGLSGTMAWPAVIPHSPEPQLFPRVALLGDAGVIVWRAGGRKLVFRDFIRAPGTVIRGPTGEEFADATGTAVLGRHDVAMSGDATVVVWRELSAAHASLLAGYLPNPNPFAVWEVDAGMNSAVDVGPLVRRAGSYFYVLNSFGDEFMLHKLDGSGGVTPVGALPMVRQDTSVDLDCPTPGACVVAFVRPTLGVYLARPGDPTARLISNNGDSVFLTHDDQSRRYVGWRSTNGYLVAEFNPSTLQALNATPLANTVGLTAMAAAGHRPVVLFGSGTSLTVSELQNLDPQPLTLGLQPDITALEGVDAPVGVVVYQWPEPVGDGARIYARAFEYPPVDAGPVDGGPLDAGRADAGSIDAGRADAGPSDAGLRDGGRLDGDAGRPDAGSTASDAGSVGDGGELPDAGGGPLYFTTQACGCSGGSEGLLVLGILLWWRRRR